MKTRRVSLGVGVAAIVATILVVAIGAQSGFAQGDPLLGTGIENPQVHREAGDRRLRDALTAMACG